MLHKRSWVSYLFGLCAIGLLIFCTTFISNLTASAINDSQSETSTYENEDLSDEQDPVEIPVKQVTLDKVSTTLNLNKSLRLHAQVFPEDATDKTVTWKTAYKNISVSKTGVVKGLQPGFSLVYAESSNGVRGYCVVVVEVPIQSVSFSKEHIQLLVNQTEKLQPIYAPTNAQRKALQYKSSNPSVVSVDSSGNVKALKAGTATITGTTPNGKVATTKITVYNVVSNIATTSTLTIGKGESIKIVPTITPTSASNNPLTWASKDSNIASVSNAVITGKKVGTTEITVKTLNNKTAKCTVNVKEAPNKISFNTSSFSIGVGEKFQVTPILPANSASRIQYFSSNNQICTVNSKGLLQGYKPGTVTITAKTFNGKQATLTITVKAAPVSMTINKNNCTLGVGEQQRLTTYIDAQHASKTRVFVSNNPGVATVNASGVIQAKQCGTATITVSTYNNIKASCKVTVKQAPTSITLNNTSISIFQNKTFNLSYKLPSNYASNTITYKSSNTKICTIDSNGKITGVGVGEATVSVTTYNGKTASCKVIVKDPDAEKKLIQNMKPLGQHPTLPTGCEITALTTVLNYYGYNVSKETMSDKYLEKGPAWNTDFREKFAGEPRSEYSYGCYAPVIVKAANKYLTEQGSKLRAKELKGVEFDALFEYTERGIPVLVWTTIDLWKGYYTATWTCTNGKTVTWYANEHCMVLLGHDATKVYVADPTHGDIRSYDRELFKTRYKELFSQAVVIQ